MIRERLSGDLKEAIKAQDPTRISTLRLICAAIKDRDLNTRSDEGSGGMPESEILGILAQMIRQRETSADAYDEAGQVDIFHAVVFVEFFGVDDRAHGIERYGAAGVAGAAAARNDG